MLEEGGPDRVGNDALAGDGIGPSGISEAVCGVGPYSCFNVMTSLMPASAAAINLVASAPLEKLKPTAVLASLSRH